MATVLAVAFSLLPRAWAGVSVSDVTAKQRYPWNGLVDIRFTVSGLEEGVSRPLAVAAVDPDSGEVRELSHFWIVRDGTNPPERAVHADGAYELVWDARADLGEGVFSNVVVRVGCDAHPMVRLWEDGPYWADRNVGAEEPWDFGFYFWWGDTIGYAREGDQWVASDGSSSGFSFADAPNWNLGLVALEEQGWITTNLVLTPEHDAARAQWGGEWRMPTERELRDLCDTNKCERTWTTTNGVRGYLVRGRGDYASASIFLPAAGRGYQTNWEYTKWGYVWASDPLQEQGTRTWRLNFYSGGFYMDIHYDRHIGSSCRPVWSGTE